MKVLFSLTISAYIWHSCGLDKIAASVPAVWHALDAILKGAQIG